MKNQSKNISFTTLIHKDEKIDVTYILIDFDVEKTFGKKRLKVKVWYDDILYRGLLTRYNGIYHLIINKTIREKLGKNAGEMVHVKIEEDIEERTVELPVFLMDFFKNEKTVKTIFERLSYSHQKEYVNWLTSAKKEITLQNRLLKFKELLQGKIKK